MTAVRPAAVAGMFYPRDQGELARDVVELLEAASDTPLIPGWPKALIAPHAGYIYSGPVAANAYTLLRPAAGIIKRVVLLGPCHRVAVRGLALPGASEFETPLGRIEVDSSAVQALKAMPQVCMHPATHAQEHSLEVQLPFLQEVLGKFKLVPLVVGDASTDEVAAVLDALWGGPNCLIVISSDLSHYHSYREAREIDGRTVQAILDFRTDIDHEEACGATPVVGFLRAARRRGMQPELLDARNSGDTAGGHDRVVGYASFAFWEERRDYDDVHGRLLLNLARAGIGEALGSPRASVPDELWLQERRATFVTLLRAGELRGCVGSLEASHPLGEDVVQNARAAARADHRFKPLSVEELPDLETEVSLLSTPTRVAFSSEAELRQAATGRGWRHPCGGRAAGHVSAASVGVI